MENISENELWGYVPETEDVMIVRPEKTLTKEEETERRLCAMFAAEIATRMDEHVTSSEIDRIMVDTKAAVEDLLDEQNEPYIVADEAMTDEELSRLHLTVGDDDHKKARDKITENAIRRAAEIQVMNDQQESEDYLTEEVDDLIPSL